ncbi:hypothetical protein MATL_G00114240 [Megalops atlanticus]|uniref:Uncharacterized protein n=1 Tax=Megalops atlanticus TaxID=7932 RepID=A0A9D3TCU1_MEGAT|nr:hypothetical protein MATL_G00114240 [Megalops atlanticus]
MNRDRKENQDRVDQQAPWAPPGNRASVDRGVTGERWEVLAPKAEMESLVPQETPAPPDPPAPLDQMHPQDSAEDPWVPWAHVVPLVPPELLVHKVSKATLESLENPVQLAPLVPVAPRDPLANLEMMVKLANLAKQGRGGPQGLRELEASPEHLAFLGSKDTEVTQVWMVQRERVELQALRVRQVHQVRTVLRDPWAHAGCPGREADPDPLELLVLVEMMVCLALLVRLVPLALQALPDSPGLQVQRVKLVPPAFGGQKEHRGPGERRALRDLPAPLVLLETLVLMASLELKEPLVLLVLQVPLVSLVPGAPLDLRELQDPSDPRVCRGTLVSQDSRERLDPKESMDLQGPREPQVQRERRGRGARGASRALQGPSAPPGRGVLLVTVVSQVKMDWLVQRVPPVSVGLQVSEDPKVQTETRDAQESRGCREPGVLLVALVMLVLKAKLALLVLLVQTVAPGRPDPWGPADSLAVCLERTEKPDLPALLALPDPLEREESRASRARPGSRVCPDLLAPQVRQENPEIRVPLERLVQLAQQDPEVSEASQERGADPGPRGCRGLGVCLGLQELMGPRGPLVLQGVLELRVPLACRECLGREAPLASQDPRVTEVTTESKDLKELLAKMAQEVKLVRLVSQVLLVLVGLLVTVGSQDPLGPQALLVPLVLTDSRGAPQELPGHRARLAFLDPKVLAVPWVRLVSPDSLVLRAELGLQAPMVTPGLLALLALQVKTGLRVSVATRVLQAGRETLGCGGRLDYLERRESPARTAHLVLKAPQVLRVWLDSVVLWDCLDSVVRGVSLAFLDPLVNRVSKALLVQVGTGAPQALWDPRV